MKKLIGIISLIGIALFFNNCMPAYVQVEPAYIDVPRPIQPSSTHIWIGGNWGYSGRSHGYVQGNGHWEAPHSGRTYREGYWSKEARGSRWVKGRWN